MSIFSEISLEAIHAMSPEILKKFGSSVYSDCVYSGDVIKVDAYSDDHQCAYVFQGAHYDTPIENDCFIVFSALDTAAYFVAEHYIQPKIAEFIDAIFNSTPVPVPLHAAKLKESFKEYLLDFDPCRDSALDQIKHMQAGPYGYMYLGKKDALMCAHLSALMGNTRYAIVDLRYDKWGDGDLEDVEVFAFRIDYKLFKALLKIK